MKVNPLRNSQSQVVVAQWGWYYTNPDQPCPNCSWCGRVTHADNGWVVCISCDAPAPRT